jgi:hypothetical protein
VEPSKAYLFSCFSASLCSTGTGDPQGLKTLLAREVRKFLRGQPKAREMGKISASKTCLREEKFLFVGPALGRELQARNHGKKNKNTHIILSHTSSVFNRCLRREFVYAQTLSKLVPVSKMSV